LSTIRLTQGALEYSYIGSAFRGARGGFCIRVVVTVPVGIL
jgi:hypothetical protein